LINLALLGEVLGLPYDAVDFEQQHWTLDTSFNELAGNCFIDRPNRNLEHHVAVPDYRRHGSPVARSATGS
jgi:hypothetical protein